MKFIASSYSNLVHALAEGIYKFKCKYGHDNNVELNTKIESAILNMRTLRII